MQLIPPPWCLRPSVYRQDLHKFQLADLSLRPPVFLERFHNLRATIFFVQGGIFLRKYHLRAIISGYGNCETAIVIPYWTTSEIVVCAVWFPAVAVTVTMLVPVGVPPEFWVPLPSE